MSDDTDSPDRPDTPDSSTNVEAASSWLPGFIGGSFLTKFVIALLLVTLVIGAVSASTYTETNAQLAEETRDEYIGIAQQSATQITEWRESRSSTARRLAQFEVIRSGNQSARQQFLESDFDQRFADDVRRVDLVDLNPTNQRIIASSDPVKEQTSLLSREAPWAAGGIEYGDDGVFISDATEIRSNSTVSFVAPVETDDGDDYAIVVQTNLDELATNLPVPGDQGFSQVVDADGRVVAGTRELGDLDRNDGLLQRYSETESAEEQAIIQRGQQGQSGFLTGSNVKESLAGDYVVAYAPVEAQDWVVATHVPKSAAFQLRSTITERLLILSVTTFVGLGLIGLIFGRGTVSALNRLTGKAERLEAGDLDVDLTVQRADEFGRLTAAFANMRDALADRIEEAEAAREEAEASRAEAVEVNQYLQRKAGDYSEVMRECANGDLTQRMETDGENEAMDTIAEEFNDMLAEIEETIADLRVFASDVATASEDVTGSAQEVQRASRQVTESVQEISDGADRQNEQFQAVSTEMDSLSTTTEEIAASSNEVADIAERTAETGRTGREAAQEAIGSLEEVEAESNEAVDAIEELEQEMAQIDELIEFIAGIADKTNMLALNANIEAARSNDQSNEGFSVVASEVKELSEETKEAAEEIEARLERIQAQTELTAEEVQKTSERVAENRDTIENAATALEDIAVYSQRTNEGVQEISAASQQQAATTEEVVAMVEEAATISQETTVEAEHVAAAAEEQTSSLSVVTESAGSLVEQATQLSRALDRFETDTDAEPGSALPSDVEVDDELELPDVDVDADSPLPTDTDLGDPITGEAGADAGEESTDEGATGGEPTVEDLDTGTEEPPMQDLAGGESTGQDLASGDESAGSDLGSTDESTAQDHASGDESADGDDAADDESTVGEGDEPDAAFWETQSDGGDVTDGSGDR